MKPGDRVMYIDDRFPDASIDQLVRYGEVYTVRWIGGYSHYIYGTYRGVKLAEIDRGKDDGPDGMGYDDLPYRASRFKPVVAPKLEKRIAEEV